MKELEMGVAEMWYLFISCSEGFKNESSNKPNKGSNWRSVNQNTLTTYIYIYIYKQMSFSAIKDVATCWKKGHLKFCHM